MRNVFLTGVVVATLLAVGGAARADYTFEFANSSGTPQSSFSVGVGQTIAIQVYVEETGTTTTLNSLGLFSGGVQLNTTNSAVANVTAVTPNAAFTGGSSSGTGSNAYVSVFAAGTAPNSVTAPSGSNAILLGTFTFTGETAGQTLAVTALPGLGPDNVLGDGATSIDSNLLNNATSAVITVTAVPEPGTLTLCGLGAVVFGGAWLRRKRRAQAMAV
jgi:hypothetical protein